MIQPVWSDLDLIFRKARWCAVSFSVHYEESSDEWYFETTSPAPSERTVTKSRSWGTMVLLANEFLDSIGASDMRRQGPR